ncbi:hypothetical protein [Verminephrobacter aporrectodeae]|nr:hypothetical protein [Verminephrobacter aporrectodeae]
MVKHQGPVKGAQIAIALDVPGNSGRVHALLKSDIQRGQISVAGGLFQWNWAYDAEQQRQLMDAASLLRKHGYKVTGGEL